MSRRDKFVGAFKRPFKAVPLRKVRNPSPLRFWEPEPPTWRQSLRRMRAFLLLVAGLTVAAIYHIYEEAHRPPPVQVAEHFTRCGYGRGV
jgi:hypothetical protein